MGTGALLNNNASYYGRYQTHENKSSTNESSASGGGSQGSEFGGGHKKGVRSSVRQPKNPKIYQSAVEMTQSNNLSGNEGGVQNFGFT